MISAVSIIASPPELQRLSVPEFGASTRSRSKRRGRRVWTLIGGAAVTLIAATFACPSTASAQAGDRDPATMETTFVSRVNQLRAAEGLAPLASDAEIRPVAQNWTLAMAEAGRISHNPNLAREVTASWRKLGENVGTGGDAESVQDAFEASPGHRKNILDPEFTSMAITVVVRGERIYVTQQFRRADAPKAPAVTAPPAVPTELALVASPSAAVTPSVRAVAVRSGVKKASSKTRRAARLT